MIITVPTPPHRYYTTLFQYVLNVFKESTVTIKYSNTLIKEIASFECLIDGKPFIFDLSDFSEVRINPSPNHIILKRTLLEDRSEANIFPMGPLFSAENYKTLLRYREIDCPKPVEGYLYCQRIYAGAIERRTALKTKISYSAPISQVEYWEKARTYKYNVFLPGANEYVFDRAPAELMFLGCTVMNPKIEVLFPYFKKLAPDTHYIEISSSGFDAIEKMNRDTGKEAKVFFENMKPENLLKWWTSL